LADLPADGSVTITQVVPEPGALTVLALGGLALLGRRSRKTVHHRADW
jgi:PEP-CTERM motif